jgi:hypothetical protein
MLNALSGTATMSKLTARQQAVYRYIWQLEPKEVAKLDKYFLAHYPDKEFMQGLDMIEDIATPVCWLHDVSYSVIFLGDRWTWKDQILGVSFRYHKGSNMAVALAKVWKTDEVNHG